MIKRPDWDNYFLKIALDVSSRSTCLRRKYGAIIVKNNVIVSTGYNGSPKGEDNCCDIGECERQRLNIPHGSNYELCKAVHAEQNAIINCNPESMNGSTIYIAGKDNNDNIVDAAPCLLCRKMIINACISKVICSDENGLPREVTL